ncbi:MAG: O13/O129/O135 family O-antigen flippase [Deltaproteobacteria bacterium]
MTSGGAAGGFVHGAGGEERPPVPTRTKKLASDTVLNLFGQILPLCAAVLLVPGLVRALGLPRFGVLSLSWMLIGYFGLFDLGLGRALTQAVSAKLGRGEGGGIAEVIGTSMAMMLALGILGAVLLSVLSPWIVGRWVAVPAGLRRETLLAVLILSVSIPFVIQTSGYSGVLSSYGRFRLLNAVRIPTGILSYLAPWIVSRFDARLPAVLAALAASRLISWAAHAAACAATVPRGVARWRVRRDRARELLGVGGWMTVSNVVGPFLVSVDRFLVGSMVSLAAVAYYGTPYDVVSRLWMIPGALTMTLFPAFGALSASDRDRAALLHDRGVKAVCLTLFPLVALLVAFAPEGLAVWLGSDFAANASLPLRLLAAGVFVNSLAHVPFALIQGAGRADLVAKLHLAELIPYLLAVVFLIRWRGIEGAALAWTARVWLDGIMMFRLSRRLLPAIRMVPSRYVLLTAVSVAGFLTVAVPTSLPVKIALLAVVVLIFYLLAWVALLTPRERGAVRERIRFSPAP